MTSWVEDKESLQEFARTFDESIVLLTKDNWFSRAIGWLLEKLTGGKFTQKQYQENAATALGNFVFIPESWTAYQAEHVIPHEAQHVSQFRTMGCKLHPMLGLPIAAIVYGLIFFPVFLAVGRFYMELDADRVRWEWMLSNDSVERLEDYILKSAERRAKSLAGPMYFWALPESWALKWYLSMARKVIDEAKLG